MEIVSKVEPLKLSRDVLLPAFPLPQGFYPRMIICATLHLKVQKRYGHITKDIEDRLNFELDTIIKKWISWLFLIGRTSPHLRGTWVLLLDLAGSAAGSAVAYCLGITNIDPIKYDLLFERFLNPERVSMPDIDIDFDDEGREKVIDYVIDKYGRNQVAQIITYGTMAARTSLRDTGG